MTQSVKLPNGDTLNFPDDMPDDAITKVIVDNYPEYAPKGSAGPAAAAPTAKDGMVPNPVAPDAPAAASSSGGLLDAIGGWYARTKQSIIDTPIIAPDGSPASPRAAPVDPEAVKKYGVMASAGDHKAGPDLSDLPVTPDYLRAMRAQWNAATPEQRLELANRQDHMGVVARRMNEAQPGKLTQASVPDSLGLHANDDTDPVATMRRITDEYQRTAASDMMDPTAEARARQLVRAGVRGDMANDEAHVAAARDIPVGAEASRQASASVSDFDFATYKKFNEDPFWSNPVVRGAVKGYEGYKLGILGLNQAIGELAGVDTFGQQAMAKDSRDYTEAMGERGGYLQRMFEGSISSIAQQAPALIGGAATGSEGLVLGSMFAQTFGQEYSDTRAKGQDQGAALTRAGLFGAFEVIGEKFGLGERLKLLKDVAHGVDTPVLAKWMANTLREELPGEMLTTTGQFLVDKERNVGMDQDAGWDKYLQQMADTFSQTLIQGAVMSSATGGAHNAHRYMRGDFDQGAEFDANAAQRDALHSWNTNGLSPSARPAGAARREPTWAEAIGEAPTAAARREPSLGDIAAATTVDDAIAAAAAFTDTPATIPDVPAPASTHATAADIDALEQQAGMTADHTPDEQQAAHNHLMGEMQARALEAAGQRPAETGNLTNLASSDDGGDWHPFPPESRTLGVPRAQMPQIRAEHRGAMVNFLNARGIAHQEVEVRADDLKPTQREFSISKVQKAIEHEGGNRAILISSDNYVLDGHHQWLAAAEKGEPIRAIRLDAPIKQLVKTVHEFPSATVDTSSASAAPVDPARPLSDYEQGQQRIQKQEETIRQAIEAQAAHRSGQASATPMPRPKPTAGDRMRERVRRENPFLGFLATHGLHIEERSDTGGQKGRAGNVIVPGFGGSLYRRTGKRLDELAQLAHEAGFLSDDDINDQTDTGGTRKLADLIERAVHSREAIEQPGMLEATAPSTDQLLIEEAQRLGIDTEGQTADDLYDAVHSAHRAEEGRRQTSGAADADEQDHVDHYADQITPQELADADIAFDVNDPRITPTNNLSDEEIDELFGIEKTTGPRADRGEAEGNADEHPREGAAPVGQPGEAGQELLTSYSADEVVAREDEATARAKAVQAERDRLEAERKRQQDAKEARARADASVDDFQLGQDAHAQLSGQRGMFDEPAPADPNAQDRHGLREGDRHAKQLDSAVDEFTIQTKEELDDITPAEVRTGALQWAKDAGLNEGEFVRTLYRKWTRNPNNVELQELADALLDGSAQGEAEQGPAAGKRFATVIEGPTAQRLRSEDKLVFAQPRIHSYEPTKARPVVLISCSDAKLEGGPHRAIDLYQGALFDVLRKWMPADNRPDVFIISAEHGLVHADTLLNAYEQPMTPERLEALMKKGINARDIINRDFSQVFIAGSAQYRELGQTYAERMRKAGFLGPDAQVLGSAAGAGIGTQRGDLADYLKQLEASSTPETKHLADQLDAEAARRKRLEAEHDIITGAANDVAAQKKAAQVKTPGTNLVWSTLGEWMTAWHQLDGRAASSKRNVQLREHVGALANNPATITGETDVGTLADAKKLLEGLQAGRGKRESDPATKSVQLIGTQLGEVRKAGKNATEAGKNAQNREENAQNPAESATDDTGAWEAPRDPNQLDDLNAMFSELLAEEAAVKPKSDDLNAMFGELLAEVSGVDPRPTVADVVADKPKKSRAKAPRSGKSKDTPESFIRKYAKTATDIDRADVQRVLFDAGTQAPAVAKILGEQGHLLTAVGDAMERLGYQHTGWDGTAPTFEKTVTQAEADAAAAKRDERTAGQAAVSAAKNSAIGFAAAIGGLGELFGANIDMKAGVVPLDETKYQKAQPFFHAAIVHFGQAAADIRDVMRAVIKAVYDKFGHETTANMQPYVVRFMEDYRAGKFKGENDVDEGAAGNAARDQEHRADEKPAAEHDIFDVSGAVDGQAPAAAGQSDGSGREQVDRAGVSGRDATTDREAGDQQLREGAPGSDGRATQPRDTAGSGERGGEGARPDGRPAGDAGNPADARPTQGDKLAYQREAASVPVKLGDIENIDATLPYLLEPQREDVHFAEKRFAAAGGTNMPGVLFTNGTGTGKTASGAGIIARQIRAGKTEGIIVVPNTGIAKDWIEFAGRLGVTIKLLESTSENGGAGPTITTYANFGANKTLADREYDWVLADESHYLMAAKDGDMTDALQTFRALTRHPAGYAAYSRMQNRDIHDQLGTITNKESPEAKELYRQLHDRDGYLLSNYKTDPATRPLAIFLSATPFAYVKSVDYAEGYLFSYPEDGKIGNSNQDGRAKFFVQHFGYRIRYHKLTEPDGKVDVGLMARQFNSWLKREGALSGRMLEVDADYGRRFIKVESALGEKIDEGMEFMREHPEYKHLYQPFMKQFSYLKRRYLLEAIKAKEALPIIQQHLDLGRKVIVIHDYKKGGASNPFHMTGINGSTTAYDSSMSPKSIDLAALVDQFKAERPDLVRLQLPALSALQTLRGAFPNALVHNGDIPESQLEENKRLFNSDDSDRNVIILQSDKGREGISLHDTTGVHPRVEVIVGMAAKPTALIQLEGRAYRTGQKSNVAFDYAVTGTAWERWTFAQTIAERTDIAEALAMGDDARALKDAIVEAFEDAGPHAITRDDGTGGKARDRQSAKLLTDWDRAKSFYYGQLKRNSSTKALEGKDYFATPEPVGLKMVEWADIRPGEDVLEPSAGHGAIARWFPTLSNKTIVEPSTDLIGKSRLAVDGRAQFIQSNFEDLNTVNKYDAIVMNPPFGSGGSTAIAHMGKAYQHLRDGGRIVALIPTGPAADAKFEKFLYGDKAPKDLYMVADIGMPSSTFERAGTGVMTRIVVLDKISDPSKAPHQVSRSYVNADDVNELFERMEHSSIPGRVKTTQPIEIAIEEQKKAPKKQPREAAPGATGAERYYSTFEFKHTKTGEQLYGAAMLNRTSMDTYKQAAAIAKQHDGWYNKFAGSGALRGFLFKDAGNRAAFMEEAGQLAEVSEGHAQAEDDGGMTFDSIDRRAGERITPDRRTHTVQVDGERRPIEDSQGRLVADDMHKQVNFWRWFGNSKAVDSMERPKVMYHGTSRLNINGYDKNGTREQLDEFKVDTFAGSGAIYVTDSADYANQYTNSPNPHNGGQIYPVYVKAERPFEFYNEQHMAQLRGILEERDQFGPEGFRNGESDNYVSASEWRHLENGSFGVLERPIVRDAIQAAGFDSYYVREHDGGWDAETETPRDVMSLAVFSPEQVKSAIGNSGRFNPASADITENIGRLMADSPLAASTEAKRVATTAKLKMFRRQLEEGKITAEQHAERVNGLIQDLDARNEQRDAPKPRERGPEWIEERLMRAARTGELARDDVAFARWLLAEAPHLAEDLGISLRTRQDAAAGSYNHINRVITLFKGHGNPETTVHEILHHTERMMPEDVQAKIVKAWGAAWVQAYKKADPETRKLLLDLVEMATDKEARTRVHKAFADGRLKYDQHYQLANPSEYWAVNATRLMKARYEAGSWVGKAKQWLRELVEKAKGLLGLKSDAPVLAGLRSVLEGTGAPLSPLMLAERQHGRQLGAFEDINRPAASWAAPEDSRLDRVLHALQDKHIDTKRVVKAVRDTIGDLGDKWDPYLQEELYHGRTSTGFKDFLEGELRPLMSDMHARGVSIPDLEEFMHMRHAEEANDYLASINEGAPDGLAGVSSQDAADYLANLPPAKARAYAALAARVDAIIKGTQQTLVDYGLEKQSTIDAWNGTYQHYVPLHREDMENGLMGNGTGAGFSVRGPASKARTGSKRAVVDILGNVALARERAVVRGEKNRIAMALYGLALQSPNPSFWKPVNPKKNPAALDAELLGMGLSPAEGANLGNEPRSKRVGKSGLVESYVSLAARAAPNVVAVRINGEDRFLFFNKDNDRALRMAQAMKNVGEDVLGWAMGKVAWATRQFAAFNTQYNPIFGIVNLVRDTSEGSINLSSTPLAGKQLEVLGEAGRLLGKVIMGRGRLSNLTGADAALWHEFQQEGGITGFRAMFSRSEDRTRELASELQRLSKNPAMKAGSAIMHWLSDYNEALENITRLSAYKVAKAHGLTNQRAASLAKNLTVNFNRKGAKTRIIGALYAFFNAATQGIARAAQTLAGPAGKRIIAGGLLLGVMQSTMLHVWGFDDADIPEFVRDKNFVVPVSRPGHGKNFLTIPLPQGFAFLPTLGQISTDFALGGGKHPGKAGARVLGTLLDTFNPLGSSTVLQTISPTVVDPIAALAENKDWTGKKIALEDRSQLHPTPGHTRMKDTASSVGKAFAVWINAATGGTKYSPGAVSPTPDQLDFLMGQFTGGVGRESLKAEQTLAAQFTGEDVPWNKVPLIGRFYGDVNDKSAISSRFYNNVKDLAEVGAELEGRRKDHVDTKQFRIDHPDYKLSEKSEIVLRELADLRHQRQHWLEKGDKVRVKEFELRMRKVMERFNNEVASQRAGIH